MTLLRKQPITILSKFPISQVSLKFLSKKNIEVGQSTNLK